MATAISRSVPVVRQRGLIPSRALLGFLLFYAIAFPKGGIKVAGVPLTIGYVITILLLIFALLRSGRFSLPFDRILVFLPCLALGLWSALVVSNNGTASTGFTISYFVSVIYLPLFGLTFFSSLVLDNYRTTLEQSIIWGVRLIVVYGIFLFFYRQLTGSWIEIPYVTVNVADIGQLDDKYINRGGIFKLISTYNNGNILGVSLAIMAPLYFQFERHRLLQWMFYTAMFLTLSRTAWIAAVLIMFMRAISKGVRPVSLLYLALGLLATGTAIVGLLTFIGLDMSFILDRNLGGRAYQLDVLGDIRVIPEVEVSPLPEIAYLGMLKYFGLPGLLLFTAHLLTPSLILRLEGVKLLTTSLASACLQGLVIYAVVAGADAAFSFIPVMMLFWMVAGMGFWYAHRQL